MAANLSRTLMHREVKRASRHRDKNFIAKVLENCHKACSADELESMFPAVGNSPASCEATAAQTNGTAAATAADTASAATAPPGAPAAMRSAEGSSSRAPSAVKKRKGNAALRNPNTLVRPRRGISPDVAHPELFRHHAFGVPPPDRVFENAPPLGRTFSRRETT